MVGSVEVLPTLEVGIPTSAAILPETPRLGRRKFRLPSATGTYHATSVVRHTRSTLLSSASDSGRVFIHLIPYALRRQWDVVRPTA